MKKKELWIFAGIVILLIVIFLSNKGGAGETEEGYQTLQFIDSTSNLFSKTGKFLDKAVTYVIQKIFYILNLLLEFIFGI